MPASAATAVGRKRAAGPGGHCRHALGPGLSRRGRTVRKPPMVKMVDTLTQPATAGLEHPRRRARVAEVLDQPRTPAGRIPGRPAALTPSSTAGRVKGATPCCLPRRAPRPRPGRASERVGGGGSGCFPGPPGSWPVTGGSLGDRRPRTGADRSGRRISPPSLPPATGRDGAATAAPAGSTPCGPGLASGRYGVGVALGARRAGTADGIENLTACRRTRTHPAGHEDDSTGSAADALVAAERRIEGCNRGASWHNGLHLN